MDFRWRWVRKPEQPFGPHMTVLTACDKHYLPYAKALLRSIDYFSPGQTFVILLIDHDQDDLAELDAIAREVRHTTVVTASDTSVTPVPMNREQRLAYYASARFLFAQCLLDQARGPVMCIDADSLVVGSLDTSPAIEADADVALWRREKSHTLDHQKVAAGVVVLFPTRGAKLFAARVSAILTDRFATGDALWYVDQAALFQGMTELAGEVRVSDLHRRFRDFETFSAGSALWSAKGERKAFGEPFASLLKIFGDSEFARAQAKHVINRARRLTHSKVNAFYAANPRLQERLPRSGTIYLPRIDLPWKPYKGSIPPAVSDDTMTIRLTWKKFASQMARHLEMKAVRMEVQELPAWEITPERINASSGDFALIAHKCAFQMQGLDLPVLFYMQEYMPWLFTLDPAGWGAGSSAYPLSMADPAEILGLDEPAAFDHYRSHLERGTLGTKFPQPTERYSAGSGSPDYDLFVPIQIPHDQVIAFFSDVGVAETLETAAAFARRRNLRLVLKPHPANPKATLPFRSLADDRNVFWSEDSIHDLVARSKAMLTINSSVGFEAMLHGKPIITLGRSLYDAVTIRGRVDDFEGAWAQCRDWDVESGVARYRAFYAWFCDRYAVDISRPAQRDRSLDHHVGRLLSRIYG
jgi:Capsule polysaccharide biosynthesis protein